MTTISIEQRTWLTTEEAAEYLRISTKTLLRAIKNMQFSYGHEYAKKNPRQKRSQFIFHRTRLEKTCADQLRLVNKNNELKCKYF